MRDLAGQFLALAEKQTDIVPLMIGHRLFGNSLLLTGDLAEGKSQLNDAIALYRRADNLPPATRFGQDIGVTIRSYRSIGQWLLGLPETARIEGACALKHARETGHAASLMYALCHAPWIDLWNGNYAKATIHADELICLGEEKETTF